MHWWMDNTALVEDSVLSEARAWLLLRALAGRARAGQAVVQPCGVLADGTGSLAQVELGQGWLDVFPDAPSFFHPTLSLTPAVESMLRLYLPLCIGATSNDLVVGHVGQSLDGQIATSTGASCYITGREDVTHTHRLRALFDVVLVGRGTIVCDDPRLTTRLVDGDNPTRVVVDPGLRASLDRRVFSDGAAPTLVLCAEGVRGNRGSHGQAEIVELPATGPLLHPGVLLDRLGRKGFRRIFVEGGGVTVSHFLQAGLVDRMHVTVSPIFLGQGRPGVALPRIDRLDEAWRPRVRRFALGDDMLFDCQFQRTQKEG